MEARTSKRSGSTPAGAAGRGARAGGALGAGIAADAVTSGGLSAAATDDDVGGIDKEFVGDGEPALQPKGNPASKKKSREWRAADMVGG